MPAARVCNVPGCPTPTTSGRCPAHQAEAERRRGSGGQRGSTRPWQAFRRRYLAANPTCHHCGQPATDIDHIDGTGRTGPRAFDPTNLRPLCHSCHSRRTAADQPGGWHPGG